jgi:hypothetical protein
MSPEAIRLRLRVLEHRGTIRSWDESRPGIFIVSVAAGPNQRVHTGRDLEALEEGLRRKALAR